MRDLSTEIICYEESITVYLILHMGEKYCWEPKIQPN